MKDKKQMIIDYLNEDGLSSTSKIADKIKSNFNQTLEYLNELKKEKKIKKLDNPFTDSMYWNTLNKRVIHEKGSNS